MNQLLNQFLVEISAKFGSQTAFRYFEQGEIVSVSYGQFVRDVYNAAAGFQEYRGRHIAILARNSYTYIVNLIGLLAADAVAVTLNVEEDWQILQGQISLADVSLILHDGEYLAEHPELSETDGLWRRMSLPEGEDVLHAESIDDPEALAVLMFTSGTTSTGKCVMIPHRCLWENISRSLWDNIKEPEATKVTESCFHCSPLYHIGGMGSVIGRLKNGCEICLNSDLRNLRRELAAYGCTYAFFVPRVIEFLHRHVLKGQLGKLKTISTGSARLAPELIHDYAKAGILIVQNYGMSEAGGVVTTNFSTNVEKYTSVGRAVPNAQISIQDGEICLKGAGIMLGYYKNPEATAAAIQDGWLHTGDLGYLDEDGYLYITGRKKNLIILSTGENINPEELENLLLRDPDVQEVVVMEKGTKICAQIYAAQEKQEEIRRFVDETNKQVAIYKRITLMEFRTEPFHRTASGKIKRT